MDLTRSIMRAADFTVALADHNVRLPLSADPDHFGVIVDAAGRDFITIDVNAARPEAEVARLLSIVITTINHQGGFAARGAA